MVYVKPAMRRFVWLIGGFLLLGLAPAWAQRQLVDRVIAVINDEAITQSELDVYLRPLYESLKEQYQGEELMRQLNAIRLKLLNQMIEDRLVFQEAKTRGIKADEGEIAGQIQEIKTRYPSEAEFENALEREGISVTELEENVRRQILIRRLHDIEIRAQVVVSPREIEEYYEKNQSEFAEEEKTKLRSITVYKGKEAEEKGLVDEKAHAKIESAEKRLRAGESFEALAKEFSEDTHAQEGGLVGWVRRGEMLSAIEQGLAPLKGGSISPILETPGAYHVFKIEEKILGRLPSLDEVREKIRVTLFRQKAGKRFKEWMDQLKARAYISIR